MHMYTYSYVCTLHVHIIYTLKPGLQYGRKACVVFLQQEFLASIDSSFNFLSLHCLHCVDFGMTQHRAMQSLRHIMNQALRLVYNMMQEFVLRCIVTGSAYKMIWTATQRRNRKILFLRCVVV